MMWWLLFGSTLVIVALVHDGVRFVKIMHDVAVWPPRD